MALAADMLTRPGRLGAIAFFVAAAIVAGRPAVGDETASSSAGAASPRADEPVLLLTGFQPFGPVRPPNSSWEGVKGLDTRSWRGYSIVCRQMRVEWGAPMRQLSAWIDELRPATVLCFGQGASDGFAIETRAHNERGSVPDNLNLTPPTAVIVSDGPMEYEATVNSRALVEALSKQGYPVRASQDAGRYLCEEALFTIEHLKAQHRIPGDVMFCHVPPLGAKIGDVSVDAAYVQTFVEALLAAWLELPHENTTVAAPAEVTLRQVADDPREAQVRELIERYFLTWNAQDIDRYGQCFMPQAAVQLMDPSGRLTTLPLRSFLESQREAHKNSTGMNETPESVEVRLEGRLARVIVHWKLVAGEKVQFGYDHFTIVPVNGQWRIANLIFYETQGEDGR